MDARIYNQYVLKIAECGSLTKAAEALNISQPALSQGLNALEKEIGIRIFNRRSVPIAFTPEGNLYYDFIRRSEILGADFRRRLSALQGEADESVTIGSAVAYTASTVPEAVMSLKKIMPQCRIAIKSAPLDDLITMAEEGKINCFISTTDRLPDQFEKVKIKNERVYLVIPSSDPVNNSLQPFRIKGEEREHVPELTDYSFLSGRQMIFLESGQPLQEMISAFLRKNRIATENSITVDQVSAALSLAVKGAGICFASDESLSACDPGENVCIYSLPDAVFGRGIYLAYSRELYMPKACRVLIDLWKNHTGNI